MQVSNFGNNRKDCVTLLNNVGETPSFDVRHMKHTHTRFCGEFSPQKRGRDDEK